MIHSPEFDYLQTAFAGNQEHAQNLWAEIFEGHKSVIAEAARSWDLSLFLNFAELKERLGGDPKEFFAKTLSLLFSDPVIAPRIKDKPPIAIAYERKSSEGSNPQPPDQILTFLPAVMELKETLPDGVQQEPPALNFKVLSYPSSLSRVEKWGKITAWSEDTSQSGIIFQSIQDPEQWAIPDPNVSASTPAKQLWIPSTQTPLPLPFSGGREFPFDHYPSDQISIVDEKTAFILLTRLDFILMQAHEIGHAIEMKPEYLGAWPPEPTWAFQQERSLGAYEELLENSLPQDYQSPQVFFELFHRQWQDKKNLPRAYLGELYAELIEQIVLRRNFGGLPAINYQWFFRDIRFNRYQQLAGFRRLNKGFAPDRNIYGFWLASIISQNCQGNEAAPLVSFLEDLEKLIAEDKATS